MLSKYMPARTVNSREQRLINYISYKAKTETSSLVNSARLEKEEGKLRIPDNSATEDESRT